MNLKQKSFSGGMDLLSKDTDIDADSYRMAFNFRQRYGYGEAVQRSIDITYNLSVAGKFQGLYGVNNIWLAFFGGKAYYMVVGGTLWNRVPGLQLDSDVDYIYIAAVPGSTNNYLRKAVVTGAGAIDTTAGVTTTPFSIGGTPAGVVCQDGLNIPWLITYDAVNQTATARQLGTYAQWDNTGSTSNNMEYVPIGLRMMYLAPTLYIQAPIKNQIYRSVSGSPLNFMINIDQDGNKLSTEALGGAATTSFAIDFDDINCLLPSSSAESSPNVFLVATSRFIYGMATDNTNTIFGEPTFTKAFTIEAGIVNQFSVSDANGDTTFIDFEGVGFFNAVQQLKFEGRNNPLSKAISKILVGISQSVACTTAFNNYNIFSLKTTLGFLNAIFDNMSQKWVSFDITAATTSGIKMFATATLPDASFLAGGTTNGKIFLLFGDTATSRETACVFARAFVPGEYVYGNFVPHTLKEEHKVNLFKALVIPGQKDGTMWATEQVDEQRGQQMQKVISGVVSGVNYPVIPPVIPNNNKRTKNITFPFDQGLMGYKINPIFSWTSDLQFFNFDVDTTATESQQSQSEEQLTITGQNK